MVGAGCLLKRSCGATSLSSKSRHPAYDRLHAQICPRNKHFLFLVNKCVNEPHRAISVPSMNLMHSLPSGLSLQLSKHGSRSLTVAAAIAAAAAGGCLLLSGAGGVSKAIDNSCDRGGDQVSSSMTGFAHVDV